MTVHKIAVYEYINLSTKQKVLAARNWLIFAKFGGETLNWLLARNQVSVKVMISKQVIVVVVHSVRNHV